MKLQFQEHVSESMFVYYNVIFLWLKIIEIRSCSKTVSTGEINLVKYIISKNYYVPEPIKCYLDGIEDFEDGSGKRYKFTVPCLPECDSIEGLPGYFGKVNSQTHAMYEAFPAPGVCAQWIMEDYKFTNGKSKTSIWNLPKSLRPYYEKEKITEPLPTVNLLGWAQATHLSYSQSNNISRAIDGGGMFYIKNDFKMFCFIEPICNIVSFQLSHLNSLYEVKKYQTLSNFHFKGSQTLALYLKTDSKEITFKRDVYYCENFVRAVSVVTPTPEISALAQIFGYRIRKNDINELSSWSCYDFNEYKDVPSVWKVSRNSIFNFGSVVSLNNAKYYSAYTNAFFLRTLFVNSFKKGGSM